MDLIYDGMDMLLPFAWMEYTFMKNALLAILLMTPLFGLLSTMVVSSRMAFFSDSLGHGAFTGIAIGALVGMVAPLTSLILFSIAFALLITWIKHRTAASADTGIGVFSALGFMAAQSGTTVKDAASSGIGLAFIAFPTIINEMPGGAIFGVLFFGSLTIAGFTSLFSLFEVVVSAVRDKLNLPRKQTAITMGVIMAVLSLALFANTGGIVNLDIMDKFTNNVGIVSIALILIVILDWVLRRIDEFSTHLNMVSSFRVGTMWRICVVNITTLVLGFTLFQELFGLLKEPYGGYTTTQVGIYGWGVLVIILVAAAILTTMKWPEGVPLDGPPGSDFGVDPEVERVPKIPQQYKHDERPRIAGFAIEQYTDEELHS